MKKIIHFLLMAGLLPLFLFSQLSYGLTRYAPSGGTYTMNLVSVNAQLSYTPIIGSDGDKYYSIAPPNREGIEINQHTSQPSGLVYCMVNYLSGYYHPGLLPNEAYHRVFAYKPDAGITIKGLNAYKINSNTYFTLYSNNKITQGWQRIFAPGCSNAELGPLDASHFVIHFPFEVRIYVKNIPVDGNIVIPKSMLAGYTRIFSDSGAPNINVPSDKASIILDLTSSVVSYTSNCSSNISNLNINHQTLNAYEFNSLETRTVSYKCYLDRSVRVKFALDYVTDSDPQKRVPLKSGKNTIYSDLTLYDADTNQRGKTFETTIDKVKNIQVESHISGFDMTPGKYTGNAWIIATFL